MEFRTFQPIHCHYCGKPVVWLVHEDHYTPTFIAVCDEHRYLPYS